MSEWRNDNLYYQESQADEAGVARYIAKVMGWMCVGLLTTFVVSMLCVSSMAVLNFFYGNPVMLYVVMFAQLGVVFAMSFAVNKISAATATVLFMLYAALTGVTMSAFYFIFAMDSLVFVFLLTAAIFLAMALYGFVTGKDLTKFGSLAIFFLFGIIAAGILNMFIGSSMLDMIICIVGIAIFIGLIAYDTQKIKGFYLQSTGAGLTAEDDVVKKAAIFGALSLYLDFINIFIYLLRILGRRRN